MWELIGGKELIVEAGLVVELLGAVTWSCDVVVVVVVVVVVLKVLRQAGPRKARLRYR